MSDNQFILAIDQGTTGTTVSIIGHDGLPKAKVNLEFEQIYPKPGWVEHRPSDIWSTVARAVPMALEKAGVSSSQVQAIGITNQRETVVAWDKGNGQPLHNAIVWQCRRTTEFTDSLKAAGHSDLINKKTGLVIDPYFSASKMSWPLKEVPAVMDAQKQNSLRFGTIDSFLIWNLTAGASYVTDVSNASRTQLMNIDEGNWDSELLSLFEVSSESLPMIKPSSGLFGKTKGLEFLPDGIPIMGVAGDQQAALFGQTCFEAGESKCTFGTGSFILMNTGAQRLHSKFGILSTVAWKLGEEQPTTYALEGGAFVCGAAVQWLRDGLEFFEDSAQVEALAASVESAEGVQLVPAFAGLGAPHWDPNARGIITGMTRGTTRAHIARATLEAMALQNVDILKSMSSDLGADSIHLKVDGGAVKNDLLMQMQADYLGAKITRPEMIETTSAGAAFLAGLGVGFWKSLDDIKASWKVSKTFESNMTSESRELRLKQWSQAVKACQSIS